MAFSGPAILLFSSSTVTHAGLQYSATEAGLALTVSSTSGIPRPGSLVSKLYTAYPPFCIRMSRRVSVVPQKTASQHSATPHHEAVLSIAGCVPKCM